MTEKKDSGKLRYDLIPPEVLEELAKVLTFGAEKYDDNNWQTIPDLERRYVAALMRHLEAHRMGELRDAESGLYHLTHALACLSFVLWRVKTDDERTKTALDRLCEGVCAMARVNGGPSAKGLLAEKASPKEEPSLSRAAAVRVRDMAYGRGIDGQTPLRDAVRELTKQRNARRLFNIARNAVRLMRRYKSD